MKENWSTADMPDLTGLTAVVTGAGSGLGRVAVRELAGRGARVISVVREKSQAEAGTEPQVADLADGDSVRELAARLHAEAGQVDLLMNNAGVMGPPRTVTNEGVELQFAVNHLAHFALTGLLLDLLRAAPAARVVTTTSLLHKQGLIQFKNLDGATKYVASTFYNQSKLANALFGVELQRRLTLADSPIRSILAHPGYSRTGLQAKVAPGLYRTMLLTIGNRFLAQSAEQGTLPLLYAATDPAAQGGQLIGPGGRNELKGAPALGKLSSMARNPKLSKRLWDTSQELTGVTFDLPQPAPASSFDDD